MATETVGGPKALPNAGVQHAQVVCRMQGQHYVCCQRVVRHLSNRGKPKVDYLIFDRLTFTAYIGSECRHTHEKTRWQ